MVNDWLRIGHLLPGHCYLCGHECTNNSDLCHDCCLELPRIGHACRQCALPISTASQYARCGHCQQSQPPFETTLSAYIYADPVRQLITRLKFTGKLALARLLGQRLCEELIPKITTIPDAILPVPLHPVRIKQRGFNQSIELARPLAKQLGIPLLIDAVERRIDTPSQTGLSKTQRRANLHRAFRVCEALPYEHIAIVDDVITTGQTITALAVCLQKAGIKRVDCWSVARALPASAK